MVKGWIIHILIEVDSSPQVNPKEHEMHLYEAIKSFHPNYLYLTLSIDCGYVPPSVCQPMCALFPQTDTPTQ